MLIGRNEELKTLRHLLESDRSELAYVYGRLCAGKTGLVREAFRDQLVFEYGGFPQGTMTEHLICFYGALQKWGLYVRNRPESWMEAFELLKELIERSPEDKKVIFLDELTWMDPKGRQLLPVLESFWNGWASRRDDIVLVLCDSTNTWMRDFVCGAACRMEVRPFTLQESKEFLESRGVFLNSEEIQEVYRMTGGVPLYLKEDLNKAGDAYLKNEFDHLYHFLFNHCRPYTEIARALAEKKNGCTRSEISEKTKIPENGTLTEKLKKLEMCGLIRRYRNEGGAGRYLYQLIDPFTIFVLERQMNS